MAQTTPNLNLTVWNNLSDPYDSAQLAENFFKIDTHTHEGGGTGLQIDGSKAIRSGTITGNQILSNSITASQLQQSTTTNDNRAVTVNHIQDESITKAKLNSTTSGAYVLPKFIAAGGSLPTATSGDEVYYETSSGGEIWHLRYNGTNWDFIGGAGISAYSSTDTAHVAAVSTNYVYWEDRVVNTISIPLPGTYRVQARAVITVSSNGISGMFSTGISIGATPTVSAYTGTNYGDSPTFAYYNENLTGGNFEASGTFNRIVVADNATSTARLFRQSLAIETASSGSTVTAALRFAGMYVVPVTLSNWTV